MSATFHGDLATERAAGLERAATALRRGDVVVLPTDTVYGIAADAFLLVGTERLREVRGQGRGQPLPVMVPSARTLEGIAYDVSTAARALVNAFWPGPLTIVVRQQPSLAWDLGDAHGTVSVRMPLHPLALELLAVTGPLAVTAASLVGQPPPLTCTAAEEQLGDEVHTYLDGGDLTPATGPVLVSSVVDCTGEVPLLLRPGGYPLEVLREVVPELAAAA